jgi:hypothetical protein
MHTLCNFQDHHLSPPTPHRFLQKCQTLLPHSVRVNTQTAIITQSRSATILKSRPLRISSPRVKAKITR